MLVRDVKLTRDVELVRDVIRLVCAVPTIL